MRPQAANKCSLKVLVYKALSYYARLGEDLSSYPIPKGFERKEASMGKGKSEREGGRERERERERLQMGPHTTICVLILPCMCSHTTTCVSSYYAIFHLTLGMYVSGKRESLASTQSYGYQVN